MNPLTPEHALAMQLYAQREKDLAMKRKPLADPPLVVCPDCGELHTTEWIDVGHGLDDAYGAPVLDVDWQLVTTCCDYPVDPALAG